MFSKALLRPSFKVSSCLRKLHVASGDFIKISIVDQVGVITLSDPGRLNALTVDMGESFKSAVAALTVAAKDQLIRAVVVTGDGDAFSAGGDLNWLADRHKTSPFKNSTVMVDFYNRFLCIRNIGVPTIAAINGAAIGAGMCMTLACDVRIASRSAKLGFTFTKLGIHPGMGSSVLLPRLVSQEVASYLLLTGAIISGEEAHQKGLVLETVDKVRHLLH
jgi:enoyl-CoA hydratase/carnithine racemase